MASAYEKKKDKNQTHHEILSTTFLNDAGVLDPMSAVKVRQDDLMHHVKVALDILRQSVGCLEFRMLPAKRLHLLDSALKPVADFDLCHLLVVPKAVPSVEEHSGLGLASRLDHSLYDVDIEGVEVR